MADAVVVPGRMFGPAAGMLMYATVVAERRGATLRRIVVAVEEFLDELHWPSLPA